MDKIRVVGGRALEGTVRISGAKNASLPDLCAALLTDEAVVLRNVPEVRDIRTMGRVLGALGASAEFRVGGVVEVRAKDVTSVEAPYDLVKTMRASVLVLGPLLAREGRARVSLPGGCAIGARPINLHLAGPREDGGRDHASSTATWRRARSASAGPRSTSTPSTVTGTENVMMAAALRRGRDGAAQRRLRARDRGPRGAAHRDGGHASREPATPTIRIEGKRALHGAQHRVIPDRIETGTFVAACAIAGGEIEIRDCRPPHLKPVLEKMRETGVRIEEGPDNLRVRAPRAAAGRRASPPSPIPASPPTCRRSTWPS